VASFTPWPLYPWYPPDGRLGGPPCQSGHSDKEKNPSPCQELNVGHAAPTLVTILTLEFHQNGFKKADQYRKFAEVRMMLSRIFLSLSI